MKLLVVAGVLLLAAVASADKGFVTTKLNRCDLVEGTCAKASSECGEGTTALTNTWCSGKGTICCAPTLRDGIRPIVTVNKRRPGEKPLPSWEQIEKAYPQGEPDEVKKTIGGDLDNPQYENTCAMRMSRTLNYADDTGAGKWKIKGGLISPSTSKKYFYNVGADKLLYLIRVSELRDYMISQYGPPTFSAEKPLPKGKFQFYNKKTSTYAWDDATRSEQGEEMLKLFKGKKGIIVFKVDIWSDATGHYDGWTGEHMLESHHAVPENTVKYFKECTRAELYCVEGCDDVAPTNAQTNGLQQQ